MSCVTTTCGITDDGCGIGFYHGNPWTQPKPGDPSNTTYINAVPARGGINVTWALPAVNAHAVAFYTLWRGSSGEFSSATQLTTTSGTSYFDNLDVKEPTTYWYWVQSTSVQGTVGTRIGPAFATCYPIKDYTLDELHQSLDESYLSQVMRERIERITLNYNELTAEIANRIASNAVLAEALARVTAGIDESIGLIHKEAETRQSGQEALARELSVIAAVNNSNAAAIMAETSARVTADSAQAQKIEQINAATKNNAAAIKNESTVRTSATSALSQQINTVQTEFNGRLNGVQTQMRSEVDAVTGKVNNLWTVKMDQNGRIGGIGMAGDGKTIDFVIIADRFWIDSPDGKGKRKPFIVKDGNVYIDRAYIGEAWIDTLHVTNGAITASNMGQGGFWRNAVQGGSQMFTGPGVTLYNMSPQNQGVMIVGEFSGFRLSEGPDGWGYGGNAYIMKTTVGSGTQNIATVPFDKAGTFTIIAFDTSPSANTTYTLAVIGGLNVNVDGNTRGKIFATGAKR